MGCKTMGVLYILAAIFAINLAYATDVMFTNILAMRDAGTFADLELVASDGSKHLCHRLMLSGRSDYWKSMLTGGLKESAAHSVTLKYSPEAITHYLDFIYHPGVKSFDQILNFSVYRDLMELGALSLDHELVKALKDASVTFDGMYGQAFDYAVAHDDTHIEAQIFNARAVNGILEPRFEPLELLSFKAHDDLIWEANFSPDGETIVSVSDDRTAKIYNAATGTLLHTLSGHSKSVYSASYSRDGKSIATASKDRTVKIWNVQDGALLRALPSLAAASITYNHNDSLLVLTSLDHQVEIWNTQQEAWTRVLSYPDGVNHTAFSHDGKYLATACNDKTVYVRKVQNGKTEALFQLVGHTDKVTSVQFSPDDQTILTASHDKSM